MKTPTPSRRPAGFTLIEILVVLAVVAILITVLLPALTRAKQNGIDVRCMANLKQIALAVHEYASENKQAMLPLVSSLDTDVALDPQMLPAYAGLNYEVMWTDRLVKNRFLNAPIYPGTDPSEPYVFQSSSIFACPDAVLGKFVDMPNNRVRSQYTLGPLGGMFGVNYAPLGLGFTPHGWNPAVGFIGPESVDRPADPSAFIIGGDAGFATAVDGFEVNYLYWFALGWRTWDGASNVGTLIDPNFNPYLIDTQPVTLAHQGRPNAMFIDGHASIAPQAVRDLAGNAVVLTSMAVDETPNETLSKAGNYFHPNPPGAWITSTGGNINVD